MYKYSFYIFFQIEGENHIFLSPFAYTFVIAFENVLHPSPMFATAIAKIRSGNLDAF